MKRRKLLEKLKHREKFLSLKTKILGISFINIVLITIVAIFSIQYNMATSREALYSSVAGNLAHSASEISRRLSAIQIMSEMILANSVVQRNLSVIKDSDNYIQRNIAYKELNRILLDYYYNFRGNNMTYLNLYTEGNTVYFNRALAEKTSQSIHKSVLKMTRKKDGAPCWVSAYASQDGLFFGRTVRRSENMGLDQLGDLEVCIDLAKMVEQVTEFSNQYDDADYLIFEEDKLVYYSEGIESHAAAELRNKFQSAYGVVKADGTNYFAVRGRIANFDWDYICLIPYDSMIRAMHFSQSICILILFSTVIISILSSRLVIQSILYHFETLIKKMKAFGKDENVVLDVGYNYEHRKDELGVIHQQFDKMVYKTQTLIQVNYKSELLKKEAELKALQNQMNPHFLYNTLASINWRAKASGQQEISNIVGSLGSLLRAMLDSEDAVIKLEKELKLVEDFLIIQKIRFEELLEYRIDMNADLLNAAIPKLIIQPLVENAIHYGMEQISESCKIIINGKKEKENLYIYVKNSGSIFEDDLLIKLEDNKIKAKGFGIGLLNIEQRIKLTFGEGYGLTLYNEGDWAIARIKIPFEELGGSIC